MWWAAVLVVTSVVVASNAAASTAISVAWWPTASWISLPILARSATLALSALASSSASLARRRSATDAASRSRVLTSMPSADGDMIHRIANRTLIVPSLGDSGWARKTVVSIAATAAKAHARVTQSEWEVRPMRYRPNWAGAKPSWPVRPNRQHSIASHGHRRRSGSATHATIADGSDHDRPGGYDRITTPSDAPTTTISCTTIRAGLGTLDNSSAQFIGPPHR